MKKFDVFVIGSGVAGQTVAADCANQGLKVGISDKRRFGGTCALRGCMPKKVLVNVASLVDQAQRMNEADAVDARVKLDWKKLTAFKKTFTQPVPNETKSYLQDMGVFIFEGETSFASPDLLKINGQKIKAEKIVIATGSKPRELKIPGEDLLTTSDEYMELENLPNKIVFVGGGYVSFELASIAAIAGAQVKILQRSRRVLKQFDPDLTRLLVDRLKKQGILVQTNSEVTKIETSANRLKLTISDSNDESADLVVHGAGRQPEIDSLELGQGDIEADGKSIHINQYLQSTTNSNVYIAGDADKFGSPLTPMAKYQGKIVAANIIKPNSQQYSPPTTATAVFSLPPLCSVGQSETELQDESRYKIKHGETTQWFNYKSLTAKTAAYKLIIDTQNKTIAGAHFLGQGTTELINLFTLAIDQKIPVEEIKTQLYAYPTLASDISCMV